MYIRNIHLHFPNSEEDFSYSSLIQIHRRIYYLLFTMTTSLDSSSSGSSKIEYSVMVVVPFSLV